MRAGGILLAVVLAGCATSSAYRLGEKAERRRDYDQAVLEYSKALKNDPDNPHYRKSLDRARLRASEEHARSGRRELEPHARIHRQEGAPVELEPARADDVAGLVDLHFDRAAVLSLGRGERER